MSEMPGAAAPETGASPLGPSRPGRDRPVGTARSGPPGRDRPVGTARSGPRRRCGPADIMSHPAALEAVALLTSDCTKWSAGPMTSPHPALADVGFRLDYRADGVAVYRPLHDRG